jgi:hypothetical protein
MQCSGYARQDLELGQPMDRGRDALLDRGPHQRAIAVEKNGGPRAARAYGIDSQRVGARLRLGCETMRCQTMP